MPGSAWAFAPGIALATIEPLVRPRLRGRASGRTVAKLLLALAGLAYLAHAYASTRASNPVLDVLAGIACASLLAAPLVLQWTTGGAWRALDNRALQWVGERAYGLFLIHVLVLHELDGLIRDLGSVRATLLVVAPLALAISIAVGALSYRVVERPFLRLRRGWRTAPVLAPAQASA